MCAKKKVSWVYFELLKSIVRPNVIGVESLEKRNFPGNDLFGAWNPATAILRRQFSRLKNAISVSSTFQETPQQSVLIVQYSQTIQNMPLDPVLVAHVDTIMCVKQ